MDNSINVHHTHCAMIYCEQHDIGCDAPAIAVLMGLSSEQWKFAIKYYCFPHAYMSSLERVPSFRLDTGKFLFMGYLHSSWGQSDQQIINAFRKAQEVTQ